MTNTFVNYYLAAKDQVRIDNVEVDIIVKYKGVVMNCASIKDDIFLKNKRKEIAEYYALSLDVEENYGDDYGDD